jgi:CDP-diacylglycerol--glycerol-3-phosphate 3-phosphatidyltransferase
VKINWREFWLAPNLLSLFRLVFAPLPVIMIAHGHDTAALMLVLLAIVTDILDGMLARRLNQVSELGKLLDPLADKIGIATLVIALAVYRDFPVWAAAMIVGRDVLILLGGLLFLSTHPTPPMSNYFGKLTALAWTLLIISYLTPFVAVQRVLLIAAVIMAPVSFYFYLRRFFRSNS